MQLSIALVTLIAFGGQAYSQVSGHYIIKAPSEESEALTAGEGSSGLGLAAFDGPGTSNQIWHFAPVGQNNVVIQSQDTGAFNGQYVSCRVGDPSPCTLSNEPQVFVPSSQGGDRYAISDESGEYQLLATEDKTLVWANAEDRDPPVFTLTRV